MKLSSINLP